MGLIDPFSAASKPMPDWDAIPSRPLPFAATLHALDLNTPHPRLPRPLRTDREELPKIFPSPPYNHGRHGSSSYQHTGSPTGRRQSRGLPAVGSDEWMESMVADCVDNAKTNLELNGYGLESLSTKIVDLRDLVTLSHKSPAFTPAPSSPWSPRSPIADPPERVGVAPRAVSLGERSFSRTQSAPASAAFFSRLSSASDVPGSSRGPLLPAPRIQGSTANIRPERRTSGLGIGRPFSRSKTGAVAFSRTQPNIGVFLSRNRLSSLPTALFEIRNITVLSLRNNQLKALPAAIGDLVHLKELNISNNLIEHLPSTILQLDSLEQFRADPNPWRQRPLDHGDGPPSSSGGRVLSPLRKLQEGSVPRLSSLCLTVLLSPRPPSHLPPFMSYDWDAHRIGGKHPLLDVEGLHRDMLPELDVTDLTRIVQAVKSGCEAEPPQRRASIRPALRVERFPASHKVPPPDDAATNMYYQPCPSRRHLEYDESGAEPLPRRIFLHAAEERVEWRDVHGMKGLPVLWQGCSPGCLSFLEEDEDEDEDWLPEEDEDEPAW